jgi:hypothetical protein
LQRKLTEEIFPFLIVRSIIHYSTIFSDFPPSSSVCSHPLWVLSRNGEGLCGEIFLDSVYDRPRDSSQSCLWPLSPESTKPKGDCVMLVKGSQAFTDSIGKALTSKTIHTATQALNGLFIFCPGQTTTFFLRSLLSRFDLTFIFLLHFQ